MRVVVIFVPPGDRHVGRAVEHGVTVAPAPVFLAPVARAAAEGPLLVAALADHVGLVERAEGLLGPGHVLRRYVADRVGRHARPALLEQLVVRVRQLAVLHRGSALQGGLLRRRHARCAFSSHFYIGLLSVGFFTSNKSEYAKKNQSVLFDFENTGKI